MNIVKCGTKATSCGIPGTITAVEIRFSNVVYEFSYYDKDMNYKHNWIHRDQFDPETKKTIAIGFHTNGVK